MQLADVRFVKELYPRVRPDDDAIERYRAALDKLPPIMVARGGILVDGFHRWQAHKREGAETIAAIDLGDLSDTEILLESYRSNARHGQQLTTTDKRRASDHMYRTLAALAPDERYAEIAEVLGLSIDSAKKYCADARRDEKKEQQDAAWAMWLDCVPQTEIAAALGNIDRTSVGNWVREKEQGSEFLTPPASRQHFDVWSFQTADKDDGAQSYFGSLPPQIMENTLWLYTQPGSVVVDLFAGSGTTIDVAKRMGRRVWASDRRGNEYSPHLPIHQHDVADGWPADAPDKADLIFLDPPYWKQAAGRYSSDDADLANKSLGEFMAAWASLIANCRKHLSKGGRIAYIISPTQDGGLDGVVIDHATDMLFACRDAGLSVDRRIIVTYQTQQATGQQVEAAREKRRLLKLYRDLVVLRES
jgi:hypothetical protein